MLSLCPPQHAKVMRSLLALAAIAQLTMTASCGDTEKPPSAQSHATSARGYRVGDDDVDDIEHPQKDPDDRPLRQFGHAATTAEDRTIEVLVKRYYTAAAAGNGPAACSMIYSGFTRGLGIAKAIPSGYTPAPGSTVLSEKSCGQVAALLFKLDHQQLAEDMSGMRVAEFRVSSNSGLLLLGFKTSPERWLPVRRESGTWKIAAFLDSEVP